MVNVEVPTLRARGDDVPVLAQHFVTRFAARFAKEVLGIHPAALARMMAYGWPGNVRELENSMERAVALARFDHVTVDDLPERVRDYNAEVGAPAGVIDDVVPLAEYEQRYVRRVLSLLVALSVASTPLVEKSFCAMPLLLGRTVAVRRSPEFDRAAQEAVTRWRFVPARRAASIDPVSAIRAD